jgi:hypothetical protein
MRIKHCGTCHTDRPVSDFSKNRSNLDGLQYRCKTCVAAHRAKKADAVKAYEAARYAKNASAKKAYQASYQRENARSYLAYQAQYRAKNAQSIKERRAGYWDGYRADNRHKVNAWAAKYRASKLEATPAWADFESIEELYFTADFLGMVTGEWHHVDHVVPLQSDVVCGLHWEKNLQILPGAENIAKGNRYWPDMP